MKYKPLGRTGLFVSELCLGTMTFGGSTGLWAQIGSLQQADAERQQDEAGHASAAGSGYFHQASPRSISQCQAWCAASADNTMPPMRSGTQRSTARAASWNQTFQPSNPRSGTSETSGREVMTLVPGAAGLWAIQARASA